MNLATGIDIIEIERIERVIDRYGLRFLERVFTHHELEEAGGRPASLAARFAAKEAVAKALGTGIGPVRWKEIEVRRGPDGQPILSLSGAASQFAQEKNLMNWSISLSHSRAYAVAMAAAVGEG